MSRGGEVTMSNVHLYTKVDTAQYKAVLASLERLSDPQWSPAEETRVDKELTLQVFRDILNWGGQDNVVPVIDDVNTALQTRIRRIHNQTGAFPVISLNGVDYDLRIENSQQPEMIKLHLKTYDEENNLLERAYGDWDVLHKVNDDKIPLKVKVYDEEGEPGRPEDVDEDVLPTYKQIWAAMTLPPNPMVEFVKGIVSPSAMEMKSSLGTFLRHDLSAVQVLYAVADLVRDAGGNPKVANDIQQTARKLEEERRAKAAAAARAKKRRKPSELNAAERRVYPPSE
jgi:hypothetical protein